MRNLSFCMIHFFFCSNVYLFLFLFKPRSHRYTLILHHFRFGRNSTSRSISGPSRNITFILILTFNYRRLHIGQVKFEFGFGADTLGLIYQILDLSRWWLLMMRQCLIFFLLWLFDCIYRWLLMWSFLLVLFKVNFINLMIFFHLV